MMKPHGGRVSHLTDAHSREESDPNMNQVFKVTPLCSALTLCALLSLCAAARAQSGKHESGLAEVNGARLYYEASGKGPAVVLVHGGLVDSRMWDAQMKPLSKRFRVVRYDIRGYGRSPAPTVEYYPHEDLRALLDYLKIERATVVGLSLGGFGYMGAALAYVGGIMMLMTKPVTRYFFSRFFGLEHEALAADLIPLVTAVTLSISLCVFPLMAAEKRLTALSESR